MAPTLLQGTPDQGTGTSAVPTIPGGISAGDVGLLVFTKDDDNNDVSTPSGHSLIADSGAPGHTGTMQTVAFADTLVGSESGGVTTTWSGNEDFVSEYLVVSGTTGIDVTDTDFDPNNRTSVTLIATVTDDDSLAVVICGGEDAGDTYSAPDGTWSSYTRLTEGSGVTGASQQVFYKTVNSGSTGSLTFTATAGQEFQAILMVFSPAAGGNQTIEGGAGSYSYSGSTASLEFGAEVTGEAGAYSYDGADATLLSDSEINTDAGAYAYMGTATNLELHAEVNADAGAYAYNGADVTLSSATPISAEAGSYAYSGTATSLEYGAAVDANAGTYAYTGTDANLESHAEINAEAGTYAYIGTDAALSTAVTISAEAGAYAYSGQAAALESAAEIGAEVGNYPYSGSDVSLESSYEISAEAGAYSYNGATAGLNFGTLLDVDAGAYAYSGATVNLEASFVISAGSGAYGYEGKEVEFIYAEVEDTTDTHDDYTGDDIHYAYSGRIRRTTTSREERDRQERKLKESIRESLERGKNPEGQEVPIEAMFVNDDEEALIAILAAM